MHPLIAAPALNELLRDDPRTIVLDVRWRLLGPPGVDAYAAEHIAGAVFVDLDADLAAAAGDGGRHPLPDTHDFEAAMRWAGVRVDSHVVVYDDGDMVAAARGWWLLRWAGHEAVQVLDGGYRAWSGEGLPTTDVVPVPVPGDMVVAPGAMPVVDADGAAAVAVRGVLVDARVPPRFRGETEPIDPVAGRIPGAVNVPAPTLLADDGRMLSVPELQAVFAEVGVDDQTDVAAYCGSGVTAAQTVLALDVAGIPASLYPGSWSEWIRDPDRPVERG